MFRSLLVALVSGFLLIFASINPVAFNFLDSSNCFWFSTQTSFWTSCGWWWRRFGNSRLWVGCDANSRLRRRLDIFFLESRFWRRDQNRFSGYIWLASLTNRSGNRLGRFVSQSELWIQVKNSIYGKFLALDVFFFEPLNKIWSRVRDLRTVDYGEVKNSPQHLQSDFLQPSW